MSSRDRATDLELLTLQAGGSLDDRGRIVGSLFGETKPKATSIR